MIANGLIFLLGALVATLLALLFVPLLWRNAQRLARRDFAATMPATMSEIRAEVDRVRADAALSVRRHEMLLQKARERAALERAEVGRLVAANARMTLTADQAQGETNVLRGHVAALEARIVALDGERARLEDENAELKDAIAEALAEAREMEERAAEAASLSAIADERTVAQDGTRPRPRPEDADASRVAVATAALLSLAREQRRGREPATDAAAPKQLAAATPSSPPMKARPDDADGASHIVAELKALAAAPAPAEAEAQERRNAQVREHIADVAARILQLTALKEGAGSRTAELVAAEPTTDTRAADTPTLAERVRRLNEPRSRATPRPSARRRNAAADEAPKISAPPADLDAPVASTPDAGPPNDPVPAADGKPASPPARAKRGRGGARSRPPSPR